MVLKSLFSQWSNQRHKKQVRLILKEVNPGSRQLTNPVYGTERKNKLAIIGFKNMPIFYLWELTGDGLRSIKQKG